MSGVKKTVYDGEINPLMAQIIELCKKERIAMFATFCLEHDADGGPLQCTTALSISEETGDNTLVDKLRVFTGCPFTPVTLEELEA